MDLVKYRKLSVYEIEKVLDQYIDLTEEQKNKLIYIDWFPFTIVKFDEPEKVNFIWRFTILFYWLYCLLILSLIYPFNWLFFGKKYLNNKNIIYRIYDSWSKKLKL